MISRGKARRHHRLGLVVPLALLLLGALPGPGRAESAYLGAETCGRCHRQAYQAWRGSHHDLAMQPASAATVLGNFKAAELVHPAGSARFSTRGAGEATRYRVTTENASGEQQTFTVAYTFGVYPLQQYLLDVGKGRYQAFTIAWDSRPLAEGGQRWFHLYPDETIPAGDPLHWTAPTHNWNSGCADCHSTGLAKNYQPDTDSYATTWAEIDVGCEACHGPGRGHLEWVAQGSSTAVPNKGLIRELSTSLATAIVTGTADKASGAGQLAACGGCHSRRAVIGADGGGSYHDNYHLALLDAVLYHRDGQIRDEVFEVGSFLQSKMAEHGVTCGNCHEPHSLSLRAEGNGLCAQCHLPATFDTPAHHHHSPESAGAQCVSCHMPATTYMVVDPRRDHSLRVPRPDLTVSQGVPNACASCHGERAPSWAASAVAGWLKSAGKTLVDGPAAQYAQLQMSPGRALETFVSGTAPAIYRASALANLTPADNGGFTLARSRLTDVDPLVRAAAVRWYGALPHPRRMGALLPLLGDPVRVVRFAALETLLGPELPAARYYLTAGERKTLDAVMTDYHRHLLDHRDRAGGLVNLALFQIASGDRAAAEVSYSRALALEPWNLPAAINLADLHRLQGRDAEAVALLRSTLIRHPEAAVVHYALGLALVRAGHRASAVPHLARAAALTPDNARYGYGHALALLGSGDPRGALAAAERALDHQPDSQELLALALDAATRSRQWYRALAHGERLLGLQPDNAALAAQVGQLRGLAAPLQPSP